MFANVRPWAFAVIEMTLCTKARSWHSAHQAHGLMDGALWLHASCGWSVSLHIGLVLLWKAMNTPRISVFWKEEWSLLLTDFPNFKHHPQTKTWSRARGPGKSPLLPCLCPRLLERMGSSWTPPLQLRLSQKSEWVERRIRWLDSLYLWTREGVRVSERVTANVYFHYSYPIHFLTHPGLASGPWTALLVIVAASMLLNVMNKRIILLHLLVVFGTTDHCFFLKKSLPLVSVLNTG